jgi:hypothetical protein
VFGNRILRRSKLVVREGWGKIHSEDNLIEFICLIYCIRKTEGPTLIFFITYRPKNNLTFRLRGRVLICFCILWHFIVDLVLAYENLNDKEPRNAYKIRINLLVTL